MHPIIQLIYHFGKGRTRLFLPATRATKRWKCRKNTIVVGIIGQTNLLIVWRCKSLSFLLAM
jgi:hypothetical protein